MTVARPDLPSLADIDVTLRETEALRAMLNGLVTCSCNMLAMLARREQALRDCREALAAHAAELAARAAASRAATAAMLATTAETRMLSFAAAVDTNSIH